MIYTALTKKAMQIAYQSHHGQKDKSEMPYIFHPIHLAEQMTDEPSTCVALLHDVIEDTDMTIERLKSVGFPQEVLKALRLMTHDKAVEYMDYVAEIKKDPIARVVKLADLRHNSDLSRLDIVDEAAQKRVEKYKAAIEFLEK
ncbi:MAG: GTP pyrophosphokinase [Oscillospiraceae bacterium]|nr:GTP pyrophosphokinase [Oscillospiraceae bacterium]